MQPRFELLPSFNPSNPVILVTINQYKRAPLALQHFRTPFPSDFAPSVAFTRVAVRAPRCRCGTTHPRHVRAGTTLFSVPLETTRVLLLPPLQSLSETSQDQVVVRSEGKADFLIARAGRGDESSRPIIALGLGLVMVSSTNPCEGCWDFSRMSTWLLADTIFEI